MTARRQNVIEADGFEDVTWGGWCPVQALGHVDGCAIYFRARGARWSLTIGRGRALTELGLPAHVAWTFVGSYGESPDAGWMDDAHVRWIILVAVAVWRARGGARGPAGIVTLAAPFVPDRWSDFGRYTLTSGAT